MATGDQNDMEARLRAVLPGGWFATTSPALGAVLAAFSWALAWGYALVQAALASVLITTAPDFWLNLHAVDYLGDTIQRRTQEGDSSFRARVLAAIFPPGATRAALIARLTILTGTAPTVFEPTQPQDTGAYG
ncbi:MAG TPA: hypothetical protein PLQ37_16475, partial [Acidiphilium sp.]|nr:hypothetical protein [Acidiphilium sp.]